MPTIGSATKTIRFSPADLSLIESTKMREDTTFNNAVHILINEGCGKKVEKPAEKTDIEAIAEMACLMGVTTEKLLSDFRELLEEGTLYYSGGRLVNPRYEDFERACEGKNIDKILESMIRSL